MRSTILDTTFLVISIKASYSNQRMTNQQINQLYFLALVPDEKLRAEVKSLKEEMRDKFNASHALKSPAHITLQMPFRRNEDDEDFIIQTLETFSREKLSFDILLDGFDCFAPRVIFIKIKNPSPIISLHRKLNKILRDPLEFSSKVLTHRLHPHMTIATRDLSEEAFTQAWPQYESKEFSATFKAKSLFLLKHNGQNWNIFKEFCFGQ